MNLRVTASVAAIVAFAALSSAAVRADTLYQAPPPPSGPGHPLQLGPDHRATQIGDLLYIVFDFSDANSHSDAYQSAKQAGFSLTGVFNMSPVSAQTAAQANKSANGSDSFVSTMMATVTDVLPSGVLAIAGNQGVVINGRHQTLHITGFVRPQDLDNTDAVLSSRVANVQASFYGDDQRHKGLLQQILSFLF